MNKILILCIAISCFLSSCFSDQYLLGGNKVYKIYRAPAGTPTEYQSTITYNPGPVKIIVSEDKKYLTITPLRNNPNTALDNNITPATVTQWRMNVLNKYYFPEPNDHSSSIPTSLKYVSRQVVLQAMVIPIKIRPRLKKAEYADSFPTNIETGFNANLALGLKYNFNSFSLNKNFLGENITTWSISFGGLTGLGAADLSKGLTRNPVINIPRKAPMLSAGIFFAIGFQRFNMGYTMGWDFAVGDNTESWVYQGKMWHGLTFAFDIIK